jgi:hypothetical protein
MDQPDADRTGSCERLGIFGDHRGRTVRNGQLAAGRWRETLDPFRPNTALQHKRIN